MSSSRLHIRNYFDQGRLSCNLGHITNRISYVTGLPMPDVHTMSWLAGWQHGSLIAPLTFGTSFYPSAIALRLQLADVQPCVLSFQCTESSYHRETSICALLHTVLLHVKFFWECTKTICRDGISGEWLFEIVRSINLNVSLLGYIFSPIWIPSGDPE